jgi:hypothetical protein
MNCQKCPQYKSCTKPCDKVNKILKDSGIHSQDWIRPQVSKEQWKKDGKGRWREIPFSSLRANKNEEKDPLLSDES